MNLLENKGSILTFYLFLPELFFFIFFIFFFIFLFSISNIKIYSKFPILINLLLIFYLQILFHTGLLFYNNISYNYQLFFFSYISNNFLVICKLIFLFLFFIFFAFLNDYLFFKKIYILEFGFLMFVSALATILSFSSNDFLILYLLLELQNISLYILISLKRRSNLAVESAIKYFLVSIIIMGLFLYGVSLCYFQTGIINFFDLELFLWNNKFDFILFISFFLIFISLLIKTGVAPFYSWIVDVYSGCSLYLLFYFLIFIKFFYFVILYKLSITFYEFYLYFSEFLLIFIGWSILVGSIYGLYQIKIKKFFIFSSILNSSFFLFIFLFDLFVNQLYFIYFSFLYSINMLALYLLLSTFVNWSSNIEFNKITNFNNLFKINSYLSIYLKILLLIISGFPPFCGFFYKFINLYLLWNLNIYLFMFIAFVFYTIGMFYYFRIIKLMFLNKNKKLILLLPTNKFKIYILLMILIFNFYFIFFQNFFLNILFECLIC